jgi:RNA polymerase sigma factor (sigma-70 family)
LDPQARFDAIYREYYPAVFRLCKGYFCGDSDLAADAAQDVFVKIFTYLDTFRAESSLSTWIYRIAVNTCLMQLRKQANKREVQTNEFPNLCAEPEAADKEEQLQRLYLCIEDLPQKDKMLMLMVLEGLPYAEIAAVMGLSEETLRVRIHRNKKSLIKCLGHESL